MRRLGLLAVSIGIHALAWGASHGRVHVPSATDGGAAPLVEVVLVPAERGQRTTITGKARDGVEPTRPTGAPDAHAPGVAGDHGLEGAVGPHRRGRDARDRMATRDDAEALARALGELAAASDAIATRGIPSPEAALGARDDTRDGASPGDALLAGGRRGLDMRGVGRGSGPRPSDDGTLGAHVLGPGSLSAASPRAYPWARGRARRTDLCVVMHPNCPLHRRRLVLSVERVSGLVDLAVARRAIGLHRAALAACLSDRPLDVVAAVGPDGHVVSSQPCVDAALSAVVLSPDAGASRLRIVLAWTVH